MAKQKQSGKSFSERSLPILNKVITIFENGKEHAFPYLFRDTLCGYSFRDDDILHGVELYRLKDRKKIRVNYKTMRWQYLDGEVNIYLKPQSWKNADCGEESNGVG